MLTAAVSALRRRGDEPGKRTHHQDAAATAFAHVRKERARDAQDAKEVRVKLRAPVFHARSEEHTSELQSRQYLVCRLLLEKKKKTLTSYMEIASHRADD